MATFTPRQGNWRFYADDGAEPSTPLANENAQAPAIRANKLRLRLQIHETGGKQGSNQSFKLQYSIDNVNFTDLGGANVWNYGNGQATDGGTTTSFKLTSSNQQGKYFESTTPTQTVSASAYCEIDVCIQSVTAAEDTVYYFRAFLGGSELQLDSGAAHPQVKTEKQVAVADSAGLSDVAHHATGTFGKTTVGASYGNDGSSNVIFVSKFTSPALAGTIWRLSAYLKWVSGSQKVRAAIYADNGGNPSGTPVAQSSNEVTAPSTAQWHDFFFNFAYSTNTPYWFGVFSEGNVNIYWDNGDAGQLRGCHSGTYPTWPTWSQYASYNYVMSIYATYDLTGHATLPDAVALAEAVSFKDVPRFTGLETGDMSDFPIHVWSSPEHSTPNDTAIEVTTGAAINGTYGLRMYGGTSVGGGFTHFNVARYYDDLYAVFKIKPANLPSPGGELQIAHLGNRGVQALLYIKIYNSSGTYKWRIRYYDGVSFVNQDSGMGAAPEANAVFTIKMRVKNGQTDGVYQVWINGVELTDLTKTNANTGGHACNSICLDGAAVPTYTLYVDDLTLSEDGADLGSTTVTVSDSLTSSEATLTDKELPVADGVGLSDSQKTDKTFSVSDALVSADALLRDQTFALTDQLELSDLLDVVKGELLKTVTDAYGLSDSISRDKLLVTILDSAGGSDSARSDKAPLIVTDLASLSELALTSKSPVLIADSSSVADVVIVYAEALLKTVSDSVDLADDVNTLKTLSIADAVSLLDAAGSPSRMVQVAENVSVLETVQAGAGGTKKTILFLVLGDLALQLTRD